MSTQIKKDDTLKFRMDAVTANLMERARTYTRMNKSKFVRESIREKAELIIAEHEKTRFTAEDWYVFFDMLENPPRPTERMKKASAKYREITALDAV